VSHYDHDISTLHTAAEQGDTRTIEALFSRGVNINARNENGETAVFIAALYAQRSAVRVLHSLGASIHTPDKLGQTPLFIAATENLVSTVQLLVELGASVHTANSYGCSPVYGAAMNGCLEVTQQLHQLGADINAANKTGKEAWWQQLHSLMSLQFHSFIHSFIDWFHVASCCPYNCRHVALLHRGARGPSAGVASPVSAGCRHPRA
jgi:ankyrin repeat protein